MACDGAGNAARGVAADDAVAAERAEGGDLRDGGWVRAVVKFFALARGGFGGEEYAVVG